MRMVDAIEEGRIVRVSESYARQEGLSIIKFVDEGEKTEKQAELVPKKRRFSEEEKRPVFDDYRKPLRYTKEPLMSELVDNFHWLLLEKRKEKNLTRKQLAREIGVLEVDIKIIENGVLPNKDFVLVSKLEAFYKINLRKSGVNYQDSFRKKLNPEKTEVKSVEKDEKKNSDIDIIHIDDNI